MKKARIVEGGIVIRQVNLDEKGAGLTPLMSAEAIEYHYGKHYAGYVGAVNAAIIGTELESQSLEAIIEHARLHHRPKLYRSAGQSWNHGFFFSCVAKGAKISPQSALAGAIAAQFGDQGGLLRALVSASKSHFASGWLWLAADADGELSIVSTQDADPVWALGESTPLLVCDLWEHAYYIDWRNDRTAFVAEFVNTWANWPLAERQFAAAASKGATWRHP